MANSVDVASIRTSIKMLQSCLQDPDVEPVIEALQALADDPEDAACLEQLGKAFDNLDTKQGAVLTYAPCVSILLYDAPYGNA